MIRKGRPHKTNRKRVFGNHKHRQQIASSVIMSHSFSEVEDAVTASLVISKITSLAGKRAAAQRKKAGIHSIFVRNNQLISVTQNGVKKVVSTKPAGASSFYVNYKPATVLHAITR